VVLDEEAEEDRKVGFAGRCWQSFCAGCASLPCLVPECARGPLLFAANHWSLASFMTLLIIGNAVLLACDAAGTSPEYNRQLALANLVFVGFFTFIAQVEKLPRITRIHDMKITGLARDDIELKAEFTLSIYFQDEKQVAAGATP
jgi:hypothetical protein